MYIIISLVNGNNIIIALELEGINIMEFPESTVWKKVNENSTCGTDYLSLNAAA